MNNKIKVVEETKLTFLGVNPDILRATTPGAEPTTKTRAPKETPLLSSTSEVLASVTKERQEHRVTGSSKDHRLAVENLLSHDNPGIAPAATGMNERHLQKVREGNEANKACLKTVIQRIRSGKMNLIEEAKAMTFLIDQKIVASQAELAKEMDKPKSKVSEKLSILKLPHSVQLMIERNPEAITEGHAVELMRLKDPELIAGVTTRVIEMGLTRDRLRTEIEFLLNKHGGKINAKVKRAVQSKIRYFPKVDGGFDLIYRFRPSEDLAEIERLINDMETKMTYLKQFRQRLASEVKEKRENKQNPLFRREATPAPEGAFEAFPNQTTNPEVHLPAPR